MGKKSLILLSANVGSFGQNEDLTVANIKVRQQTIDTLCEVENEYAWVDIFCVQECNSYHVELRPIFYEPISTDETISFGRNAGGIRGVATYAKEGENFNINNDIHECCVTVHQYSNSKNKQVKVAVVNLYRNISRNFERTIGQTISFLTDHVRTKLYENGIRNIIIIGDFNHENVNIRGFREIKHDDAFHKANKTTRKTFIDKCFANFSSCGLIKILPSLENVHNEDGTKSTLGHKVFCIYIGAMPEKAKKKTLKSTDFTAIKKEAKNIKLIDLIDIDRDPKFMNKSFNDSTEIIAENLSDTFKTIISKSTKEFEIKDRRIDHILVSHIEKNLCGRIRSDKAWKPFYSYCTIVKNEIEMTVNEKKEPSIFEKVQTLNKKLDNLNMPDKEIMTEMIDRIYEVDRFKKGVWVEDIKEFTKIILSTSNSGAKDCLGMSLKITKTIFDYSPTLTKRFQLIARRCLQGGFFPEVWKLDKIIFIYKNKGDFDSAKNWRPITIAVSLGKTLEKVASHFLSNFDDRNVDNHAYTKGRSCLTCIASVQMDINRIIQAAKDDLYNRKNIPNIPNSTSNTNPSNDPNIPYPSNSSSQSLIPQVNEKGLEPNAEYDIIPLLSLDDISSAFESVVHYAIHRVLSRQYAGDDFDIANFLVSYLNRNAFGIDNKTNERANIIKRHSDRSTPQGSLLSPMIWRIFDKIFSEYYKMLLKQLVENRRQNRTALSKFAHDVYADDQNSPLVLLVKSCLNLEQKCIEIRKAFLTVRELIQKATKTLGCGVNPAKSENIVPAKYIEPLNILDMKYMRIKNLDPEIEENRFIVKDTFKWLGYTITFSESGLLTFCQTAIKCRLVQIGKFRDNVYQYTFRTFIRIKIYQVYLTPFIELYLPLVVQHPTTAITLIHKFQHSSLTRAIGVSFTTKREDVEEIMGSRSVLNKTIRMSARIQGCCNTERVNWGMELEQEDEVSMTRSGRVRIMNAHETQVRKNFIFRLNLYAGMQDEVKLFEKKALDIIKIEKWAEKTNKNLKWKIQERLNENNPSRRRRIGD